MCNSQNTSATGKNRRMISALQNERNLVLIAPRK